MKLTFIVYGKEHILEVDLEKPLTDYIRRFDIPKGRKRIVKAVCNDYTIDPKKPLNDQRIPKFGFWGKRKGDSKKINVIDKDSVIFINCFFDQQDSSDLYGIIIF